MNKDLQEEFILLLEQHKAILYKVSTIYCKNATDRNDLVQEIILQAWKSFKSYRNQFKFSTWIYRIAINVSISFYRKESRKQNLTNTLTENVFEIPNEINLNNYESKVEFLYVFINQLNDLDKAIMLLYLEEKPQQEIGEIVGLSATNISTKIYRLKDKLKHFLINKNIQ